MPLVGGFVYCVRRCVYGVDDRYSRYSIEEVVLLVGSGLRNCPEFDGTGGGHLKYNKKAFLVIYFVREDLFSTGSEKAV